MKTIDIVYFNAGGGHRAAATALEKVFARQNKYNIRLINFFDMLDPTHLFERTTGMEPEDLYNKRLAKGWTLGLTQELKLFQFAISLGTNTIAERLRKHWNVTKPDLIISVIPNFNRPMYLGANGIPYVTILTDFADFPPHFWIEPDQDQHFICGTDKAVQQAIAMHSLGSTIHKTSGMIIRPEFYEPRQIDREAELEMVGLDPTLWTGIVMFGGHGSNVMKLISRELENEQLIFICGHNKVLAEKLRKQETSAPRLIVDFTQDIKYYMNLADYFIGKPGPGSISEALHQQLPVIVERNMATLPQERYNTEWVEENKVGVVLKSFSDIKDGVSQLVNNIIAFKERISKIENKAIFEIPEIVDNIMSEI